MHKLRGGKLQGGGAERNGTSSFRRNALEGTTLASCIPVVGLALDHMTS